MKNFRNGILTSLVFIGVLWSSSVQGNILTQLNSNNDQGIWLEETGNINLTPHWILKIKSEQRIGANYKKLWHCYDEYVVHYNFLRFVPTYFSRHITELTMGPGYNGTSAFMKNTLKHFHWSWANRAILECYVTAKWNDWTIGQKLRGEYYGYSTSHYKCYGLFRYRLTIITPWKFTCWNINPYVSNEWFFENKTYSKTHTTGLVGPYYENRLRVGIETKIWENLRPAFFWQWRVTKQKPGTNPGWFNLYYIGLDFRYFY